MFKNVLCVGVHMTQLEDRFRKLKREREQNLIDRQARDKEQLSLLAKQRDILYPTVKEVCEDFASALGFRIHPEHDDSPWYRRRKVREGAYTISYTPTSYMGQRGKTYYIQVRTNSRLPRIEVEVYAGGFAGKHRADSLSTVIDSQEIGVPANLNAVRKALAEALEKAATPYVENRT